MTEHKQKIVCAAIRHRVANRVVVGVRHFDNYMFREVMNDTDGKNWEHGFVDNNGQFFNRQESYEVALKAGQIEPGGERTLTSEDLY